MTNLFNQNASGSLGFAPCQLLLYPSALMKLSIQVGRVPLSQGHISPEEDEERSPLLCLRFLSLALFVVHFFLWRDFKFSSVAEGRLLDVESVVLHFRRLSAIDVGVCICVLFFFKSPLGEGGELASYQLSAVLLAAFDLFQQWDLWPFLLASNSRGHILLKVQPLFSGHFKMHIQAVFLTKH